MWRHWSQAAISGPYQLCCLPSVALLLIPRRPHHSPHLPILSCAGRLPPDLPRLRGELVSQLAVCNGRPGGSCAEHPALLVCGAGHGAVASATSASISSATREYLRDSHCRNATTGAQKRHARHKHKHKHCSTTTQLTDLVGWMQAPPPPPSPLPVPLHPLELSPSDEVTTPPAQSAATEQELAARQEHRQPVRRRTCPSHACLWTC